MPRAHKLDHKQGVVLLALDDLRAAVPVGFDFSDEDHYFDIEIVIGAICAQESPPAPELSTDGRVLAVLKELHTWNLVEMIKGRLEPESARIRLTNGRTIMAVRSLLHGQGRETLESVVTVDGQQVYTLHLDNGKRESVNRFRIKRGRAVEIAHDLYQEWSSAETGPRATAEQQRAGEQGPPQETAGTAPQVADDLLRTGNADKSAAAVVADKREDGQQESSPQVTGTAPEVAHDVSQAINADTIASAGASVGKQEKMQEPSQAAAGAPAQGAENGPVPPNRFRWNGHVCEMEPRPFALLRALWPLTQEGEDAREVQSVMDEVWGENHEAGDTALRSALSRANAALAQCGCPVRFNLKAGSIFKSHEDLPQE